MLPHSIHYDLINERDVYSTVYYAALVWHYHMQSMLFYCVSFCMHYSELFFGITLTSMKFVPKPSIDENPVLNLKSFNRFKMKSLRINHIPVLILDCSFQIGYEPIEKQNESNHKYWSLNKRVNEKKKNRNQNNWIKQHMISHTSGISTTLKYSFGILCSHFSFIYKYLLHILKYCWIVHTFFRYIIMFIS